MTQNSQFGLKIRGSRKVCWIVLPFDNILDAKDFFEGESKVYVTLVGSGSKGFVVSCSAVDAICGPNSPGIFEEIF